MCTLKSLRNLLHCIEKKSKSREFLVIRKIKIRKRRTAAYLAGGAEPLARVSEAQGEDARVVSVQLVALLHARRCIHHLNRDQRSKINLRKDQRSMFQIRYNSSQQMSHLYFSIGNRRNIEKGTGRRTNYHWWNTHKRGPILDFIDLAFGSERKSKLEFRHKIVPLPSTVPLPTFTVPLYYRTPPHYRTSIWFVSSPTATQSSVGEHPREKI